MVTQYCSTVPGPEAVRKELRLFSDEVCDGPGGHVQMLREFLTDGEGAPTRVLPRESLSRGVDEAWTEQRGRSDSATGRPGVFYESHHVFAGDIRQGGQQFR